MSRTLLPSAVTGNPPSACVSAARMRAESTTSSCSVSSMYSRGGFGISGGGGGTLLYWLAELVWRYSPFAPFVARAPFAPYMPFVPFVCAGGWGEAVSGGDAPRASASYIARRRAFSSPAVSGRELLAPAGGVGCARGVGRLRPPEGAMRGGVAGGGAPASAAASWASYCRRSRSFSDSALLPFIGGGEDGTAGMGEVGGK